MGLPEHGKLTGTPPDLVYTADSGYHGQDGVGFKVDDGHGRTSFSTVQITVKYPDGEFTGVTPARLLDTRDGTGRAGVKSPIAAASSVSVDVTGIAGVPEQGVAAVVVNLTATQPTRATYLTVWPGAAARPIVSNVNVLPGQTRPNLVTVKVGTNGRINIYNNLGTVHAIVDIVGFYSSITGPFGSRFQAGYEPWRLIDTRDGTGLPPRASGRRRGWHDRRTGSGGRPNGRHHRAHVERHGDPTDFGRLSHCLSGRRESTPRIEPQLRAGTDDRQPGHGACAC